MNVEVAAARRGAPGDRATARDFNRTGRSQAGREGPESKRFRQQGGKGARIEEAGRPGDTALSVGSKAPATAQETSWLWTRNQFMDHKGVLLKKHVGLCVQASELEGPPGWSRTHQHQCRWKTPTSTFSSAGRSQHGPHAPMPSWGASRPPGQVSHPGQSQILLKLSAKSPHHWGPQKQS